MCNNRIKFDPDQSKSDEEKMTSVSLFHDVVVIKLGQVIDMP